ncbi:MAG: hypothetical protein NWR72_07060 [Bacteroidia bacterium]|nr:hypothetical protein [Bacteroidia bacterium]
MKEVILRPFLCNTMFATALTLLVSLIFPITSSASGSDLQFFVGEWDQLSTQSHRIEIAISGDQLMFRFLHEPSHWITLVPSNGHLVANDNGVSYDFDMRESILELVRDESGATTQSRYQKVSASRAPLMANADGVAIPIGMGAIKGMPVGPARSTASIFRVYLYRLGDGRELVNSQTLNRQEGFHFEGLADGRYQLMFSAQGPTAIQPNPAFKIVEVRSGTIVEQDVELH